MSTQILVTKFFIPALRSKLVPRTRLIKNLDEGLNGKIMLISAPAGFGKTTLVTEWLNHLGQYDQIKEKTVPAWLSLDDKDNDLVLFLTYIVTALNRVVERDGDMGKEALQMLQSPQPLPPETILTSLINDLAAIKGKIILVLDDLHLIESNAVHDALNFLVENQPPQLHLVISTRIDPPLTLSRLRASGQLADIRAADLCFTSGEAVDFLNKVMMLGLEAEDITVLESRTEGWIAGLQLAALSLQGRSDAHEFIQTFAGSNRLILDYLMDEVLNQQPVEIQDFMLQTAILERLSAPLCDAIWSGDSVYSDTPGEALSSQHILEKLENSNLFIVPLDENRQWYRYHHLFADLLRQRLNQVTNQKISELHCRASKWYAENDFRVASIDHALLGNDFEFAIERINADYDGNYEDIYQLILQRWLSTIPDNMVITRPRMLLLKAWNLFNQGQIDQADQTLSDVMLLLGKAENQSETLLTSLTGRTLAIQSFIASIRGNPAECEKLARQAYDIFPASEKSWRSSVAVTLGDAYTLQGNMAAAQEIRAEALQLSRDAGDPFITIMNNLHLAETYLQQGQIHSVVDTCEAQFQFANEHAMSEAPIAGWLFGLWGAALAELNHMEQALDMTQKGAELAENQYDIFYLNYAFLHRVRVLFAAGDLAGAETILKKWIKSGEKGMLPLWATSQISAWQVRIWLLQGKKNTAYQWQQVQKFFSGGDIPYAHEPEYIAQARILLDQGNTTEAAGLLDRLKGAAESGGRYLRVIELLLLLTLANQGKDDQTQAMAFLCQALKLGENRGIIRPFLDEGPDLARLLLNFKPQDIEPAFIQRILAAFPKVKKEQSKMHPADDGLWIEPLSDRETEILQFIAMGLTNQKVGERLFLATNTVKTHLRNVYGKLGVNSRTHAVARARSLGLISDPNQD